jgi:periplasmic divalent cation tolerance protein
MFFLNLKFLLSFFLIILASFFIMNNVFSANKLIVGFVSLPNQEVAKKIARILVGENLAACAKVINNIESFYMWEGKLQEDSEVYLMIKSKNNKISSIKKVLDKEHPYKVYEFLCHEVKSVNDKYTEWINSLVDDRTDMADDTDNNGQSLV